MRAQERWRAAKLETIIGRHMGEALAELRKAGLVFGSFDEAYDEVRQAREQTRVWADQINAAAAAERRTA